MYQDVDIETNLRLLVDTYGYDDALRLVARAVRGLTASSRKEFDNRLNSAAMFRNSVERRKKASFQTLSLLRRKR